MRLISYPLPFPHAANPHWGLVYLERSLSYFFYVGDDNEKTHVLFSWLSCFLWNLLYILLYFNVLNTIMCADFIKKRYFEKVIFWFFVYYIRLCPLGGAPGSSMWILLPGFIINVLFRIYIYKKCKSYRQWLGHVLKGSWTENSTMWMS